MKRKINCPKCGSTNVVSEDSDDYDDWTPGYVTQFCWGRCDDCGTLLTWKDYYKYDTSYNIEIEED
jgi:hypothetical protein